VKPKRTEHQREIMGLVIKAANNGTFLRQDELQGLLSYGATVTYGAIRVSIRFLEEQGMLKRVKDGPNRRLVPLERGYDWFRPAK
jgi:hypothetical protein